MRRRSVDVYKRQSLYLPPSGLLLMQVRVPDRIARSKRRNFYDKTPDPQVIEAYLGKKEG